MSEKKIAKIAPIKHIEYEVKQSSYHHVPQLPIRAMLCAPSGSGKSVLLSNMVLDIYKDCFNRVYIFSPSIEIDNVWKPVKEYLNKHCKDMDDKEPKLYYDEYDSEALEKIIEQQSKIIHHQKNVLKHKKLYQILIIVDDFADSPEFTRQSKLLHQLYIRGRHSCISTITSTQVYKAISPIIRKNVLSLILFRLRNYADLEAVSEEVSAVVGRKAFMKIYEFAVSEPYSFLYIDLASKQKTGMFHLRFEKLLIAKEK